MRLTEFRYLAGLEVKLYSDVPHHAEHLVDLAGGMHADMQASGRSETTQGTMDGAL